MLTTVFTGTVFQSEYVFCNLANLGCVVVYFWLVLRSSDLIFGHAEYGITFNICVSRV